MSNHRKSSVLRLLNSSKQVNIFINIESGIIFEESNGDEKLRLKPKNTDLVHMRSYFDMRM